MVKCVPWFAIQSESNLSIAHWRNVWLTGLSDPGFSTGQSDRWDRWSSADMIRPGEIKYITETIAEVAKCERGSVILWLVVCLEGERQCRGLCGTSWSLWA
jgi:hypothetical protein